MPPIDEVMKKVNQFQPKDPFLKMAKIRFDAVLALLKEEKLKEELYNAFYPLTIDSKKSDPKDFFKKASEIQRKQEILWMEMKKKKPELKIAN
jgi:hypothetical protein